MMRLIWQDRGVAEVTAATCTVHQREINSQRSSPLQSAPGAPISLSTTSHAFQEPQGLKGGR